MSPLSYMRILTDETPIMDKIAIPTSCLAVVTLAHFQSAITLLIAVVTLLTMLPRMLIAWGDWKESRRASSSSTIVEERIETDQEV